MAQVKLKPAAKILIVLAIAGAGLGVYQVFFRGQGAPGSSLVQKLINRDSAQGSASSPGSGASGAGAPGSAEKKDVYRIALSEWPGHMPMVLGNGGLTTAPGSAADALGIRLEIIFIEDPVKKNEALQQGNVDFVWQVVDEMPINMGSYKKAGVEAKAFLQIDWSHGGDACVAAKEVRKVEDIHGRKSAMMRFSPDHTVFEFMITNSRLTPEQIAKVRSDTRFSPDDPTFGRELFVKGEVDVACLWEPDVTLALKGRPGSHRLFSTADATELVADVLLARSSLLAGQPEIAAKVAQVWFAGVDKAAADKRAAAALIAQTVPRFRDELGAEGTEKAFDWVKWTNLADNARFFGIAGGDLAFDRVYNQADTTWVNYPDAGISERFMPAGLRDTSIVQKLWQSGGEKPAAEVLSYDPKIAEVGEAVFTKPVTINFDTGKSDLDPESMHIINNQVMPQLLMARGMYVRVEGNTDNTGDKNANQKLSEARAQAVVDYLVQKGIDSRRVTAKGNGDANPMASNKTTDGRASNRRTDVLFIRAN